MLKNIIFCKKWTFLSAPPLLKKHGALRGQRGQNTTVWVNRVEPRQCRAQPLFPQMLFRYRCNTYSRYTDRRKYRLCPEATAMVIYTVLRPAYSRNFFLPPSRAPPRTPAAQNARRGCCLLKCYTYFWTIHTLFEAYTYSRTIHFLELCTFSSYTHTFWSIHIFSIYHIHIMLAKNDTPDAPSAHYTRAEGLEIYDNYAHLYQHLNQR